MKFQPGVVQNPSGRAPKRLDDATLELVAELAAKGCHEVSIARHAGVSYPTWQRMRERDPRVRAALARGRAQEHDFLTGALHRMTDKNNVAAAIFMLKARHGYSDQGNAADARPAVIINLPGAVDATQYAKAITVRPVIEGAAERDDGSDDGAG